LEDNFSFRLRSKSKDGPIEFKGKLGADSKLKASFSGSTSRRFADADANVDLQGLIHNNGDVDSSLSIQKEAVRLTLKATHKGECPDNTEVFEDKKEERSFLRDSVSGTLSYKIEGFGGGVTFSKKRKQPWKTCVSLHGHANRVNLGGDFTLNEGKKLVDYNVGVDYSTDDLLVAAALEDQMNNLKVGGTYSANTKLGFSGLYERAGLKKDAKQQVTLGLGYHFSRSTTLFGKLSTEKMASVAITTAIGEHLQASVATDFNWKEGRGTGARFMLSYDE